jgi:hypothetical protein
VLAAVLVGFVLRGEHGIQRIHDAARELVLVHALLDRERRFARGVLGKTRTRMKAGARARVDDLGLLK